MSAAPNATTTGRAMADRDVREAVLTILAGVGASATAQARVAAPVDAEQADYLAGYRARLEQIRDGLGKGSRA